MSRVNDDNSDSRRIAEMNEAALRKKADNEKKGLQTQAEQSFREVMRNKSRREVDNKGAREEAVEKKSSEQESVLDRIRKKAPKSKFDAERRAALNRQMKGGLLKKNEAASSDAARAESTRAEELVGKAESELEHVEKDALREEDTEVVRTDEKQAEVQQEALSGGPTDRADPDGHNRQQRQQGNNSGERKGPEQAAQVEGARRGTRVVIPQEVLRRLVSAIYKAVTADGRTSMQITLKGGKLEGVTVNINAEGGKVRCEFSNCGKEIKGMLKRGTKALAEGLSRRGLKLEALTVTD